MCVHQLCGKMSWVDEDVEDAMIAVVANARLLVNAVDDGETGIEWLNGLRASLDNLKETIA